MNAANLTAAQLVKRLRRFKGQNVRYLAMELAERIESGPRKSCIPKKKLRAAGLLPPVCTTSKI